MGVKLEKGYKISLEKEAGHPVRRISMGLGWSAQGSGSGGFFKKIFSSGQNIDLDASCIMVDGDRHVTDTVWFSHLASNDGSVRHSGDNLTGKSGSEHTPDEVISVDLQRVPENVQALVFTVCSFRGQTFKSVANAFCVLTDDESGEELCSYDISGGGENFTALIMCRLYRHNDEWKVAAIGEYCNGRTIRDLEGPVKDIL